MLYFTRKGSETKRQSNSKKVDVGAQSHGTRICRAELPKSEMEIGTSVFLQNQSQKRISKEKQK